MTSLKTKKIIRRALVVYSVTLLSWISSPFVFNNLSKREDEDVREYVQENIEEIISAQEAEMGIKYNGRPNFRYRLPESMMYSLDGFSGGVLGWYSQDEDTVYLRSGVLTTPNGGINDFLAELFTWGRTSETKPVLDHELVHYYTDKRGRELTGEDWIPPAEILQLWATDEDGQAFLTVVEGIAVYIEQRINCRQDSSLQSNLSERYQNGFFFVKPIIDPFGSRGIDYLIVNTPLARDIASPNAYYTKAFSKLSKEGTIKNTK